MRFRDWFKPSRDEFVRITFDANGLSVSRQAVCVSEISQVSWSDVKSAVAYKKDCFAVDQIRVEFFDSDDRSLLITEDDEGFRELMEVLGTHLPGMMEDWHQRQVLAPAFKTNLLEIYKKES